MSAAVVYVLRFEDRTLKGKVTTDRGGLTRFGIARKFNPDIDPAFYTMPAPQALEIAKKIYDAKYGQPLKLSSLTSQPLANKLLDLSVNSGPGTAAKLVQTAVCDLGTHIPIDLRIGSITVAAINGCDQSKLMDRMITLSERHYRETAIKVSATKNELDSWLARAARPGI